MRVLMLNGLDENQHSISTSTGRGGESPESEYSRTAREMPTSISLVLMQGSVSLIAFFFFFVFFSQPGG